MLLLPLALCLTDLPGGRESSGLSFYNKPTQAIRRFLSITMRPDTGGLVAGSSPQSAGAWLLRGRAPQVDSVVGSDVYGVD